jgi:hypothetical protein
VVDPHPPKLFVVARLYVGGPLLLVLFWVVNVRLEIIAPDGQ